MVIVVEESLQTEVWAIQMFVSIVVLPYGWSCVAIDEVVHIHENIQLCIINLLIRRKGGDDV
jgi:hypothetical protein